MIRLLLATLFLLLCAPLAQAASFDCTKASTAVENAVCSNPALSHLDDVLATAYATALGGLSKAATDAVKADQHAWIGYAERVCTDDAQPLAGAYSGDQLGCLETTYRSRLTQLEASRMQGEYRFYPVNRFAALPDPDAGEAYAKVADKVFSTVRIDGSDDVATAFNAMVASDMASHSDFFGADGKQDPASGDASTDETATLAVEAVTTRRISLSSNSWWFGHGAAHGNYAISYLHFLTDERRLLVAGDIFAGANWKADLGKLTLAALQKSIEDGVWDDSIKDIPDLAADPTRWNFSDSGLIIQFQPYEVTAYAAGAPTVTIPWDALTDDLAEHALDIVY